MKSSSLHRIAASCAAAVLAAAAPALPLRSSADFPPYTKVLSVSVVAPLSGSERQLGIDLSNGVQLAIQSIYLNTLHNQRPDHFRQVFIPTLTGRNQVCNRFVAANACQTCFAEFVEIPQIVRAII